MGWMREQAILFCTEQLQPESSAIIAFDVYRFVLKGVVEKECQHLEDPI